MFEFQPHLKGELLAMRPYRPEDWDALLAAASDALIWDQHPIHGEWREDVFRASIDRALADQGGLVAIDLVSRKIVGFSRYSTLNVEPGEIEIGWTFLARSHWGGPCNRDMKRMMLAHALATWPVVIFRIGVHNLRSRRAMEKIGGKLMDRTQVVNVSGAEHLHVCYAITRHSFASSDLYAGQQRVTG
ncbi:MAG: GNAT family N-acetyltransferase [Hyphomonas sp.]|nr:GNAT family N-acetyltransferase [Hyphomonas sp.]